MTVEPWYGLAACQGCFFVATDTDLFFACMIYGGTFIRLIGDSIDNFQGEAQNKSVANPQI